MDFTSQNSLKIIGIILLSVFLGACGGGTSDLPGAGSATSNVGLPNSPIVEVPVGSDILPPDDIPSVPTPSNPTPSDPIPSNATPSSLASRIQGVAPLAVFFDAINVPGVTQPPEINGRREYANFHYTWNFDDPTSGTWAVSGKSKNKADGYVAAHVFETPGTYTVSLHVTDGASVDEWHQVDIIVEDPDTFYAGGATICVSSSGNFIGCPTGAQQVTTSAFSDVSSYIASDRRILFRRGDSWTTSSTIHLGSSSNPRSGITIGAYGNGTGQNGLGIYDNAPLINFTGGGQPFDIGYLDDSKIMDLAGIDINNNAESFVTASPSTDISRILHLRLKAIGFRVAFRLGINNTPGHDQIAYVECDGYHARTNVGYTGSERIMILGNYLRDPVDSHVLRVWQAYKGVIAHNRLSGSSSESSTARHALKLHGPEESAIGCSGSNCLAHRTRWVIVADNIFGTSGTNPVAIGPIDTGAVMYVEDILIEKNRFYAGYGTFSTSGRLVQNHLSVWGRYYTVRNNVFDADGAEPGFYTGIRVNQRGNEWSPLGHRIYNNTIYRNDGGNGDYVAVSVESECVDTTVMNNLVYFNTTGSSTVLSNASTSTTESNNMRINNPDFVDPDNGTWLSKDFRPELGSPAIDAGTNVPVFTDIAGNLRSQGGGYDLGAYERQ